MDQANFLTDLSYKFEKEHIMTKKKIFDKITHFKNEMKKYKYSNITRILLKIYSTRKKNVYFVHYIVIILLIFTREYSVSAYNGFNFSLNLEKRS